MLADAEREAAGHPDQILTAWEFADMIRDCLHGRDRDLNALDDGLVGDDGVGFIEYLVQVSTERIVVGGKTSDSSVRLRIGGGRNDLAAVPAHRFQKASRIVGKVMEHAQSGS